MSGSDGTIYHLAAAADWDQARAEGVYRGSQDDHRDGFMHFSTAAQVAESAARHRAGCTDVMLVAVDAARLGAALRWERSRGGALFPHLYGELSLDAVTATWPLPLNADGRHVFPPEIAGS